LYFISYGYELKRQYDQALDFWNKGLASEGHTDIAEQNKKAYAVSGWPGVLRKKIERGSNSADLAYYDPDGVAETYVKLGDKEKAFEWLERAYSEQVSMAFLQVDPDLAPLHSDRRYAELVRRIGFPDGQAF